MDSPLRVVCVSTGDSYGPEYLTRFVSMLARHLHEPYRVVCVTDRPWALPLGIEGIDASGWGLDGWFNKLRLFDRATLGEEAFLYLDLTLVIKEDLAPSLAYARAAPEPVVGVRDWNYDSLNTCCLWIRPGETSQKVWDAYRDGVRFDTGRKTDQDHANAVLRPQEGALGFFPEGMIVSYKRLRKLNRREAQEAARQLAGATVLKFHGEPKPHQVVDGWGSLVSSLKGGWRRPSKVLKDRSFLVKEVRRWWA